MGESEQKVAELFQRAHDEEQVILLDEVDSLLSSREALTAHHEHQLVNEFLTQIECFTQPLFAATNFSDKLDKAVLRRFDFKLDCQYLTSTQVVELYKKLTKVRTLKEAETQKLSSLRNLTPVISLYWLVERSFNPKFKFVTLPSTCWQTKTCASKNTHQWALFALNI